MNTRIKKSIAILVAAVMVLAMAIQSFAAPLSYAKPTVSGTEPVKVTGIWNKDAAGNWHFNSQGRAAKGGWYYLNTTNKATDYNWFCFDANGVMRTGWVQDKKDPSAWYYTGETKDSSEGGLVRGWITDPHDGKKYYTDPSTGIMCYGWKQLDGVWYYFGEKQYANASHPYGAMYVNEKTPDGYYVGSNGAWRQYTGSGGNSGSNVRKYAIRATAEGNHGTVTVNVNGRNATMAAEGEEVNLTANPDVDYKFDRWEVVSGNVDITGKESYSPLSVTMPASDLSVIAHFSSKSYTLTINTNKCDVTAYFDDKEATPSESYKVLPNTKVALKASPSSSSLTWEPDYLEVATSSDGWYRFTMPVEYVTFTDSYCIAAGTMITMADGSRKPVEDIVLGEKIRTFDHETGEISDAPVCYLQEDKNISGAFVLHFDDNTDITVIEEHGFYDKELNRYAFINPQNASEYIGHHFYNADDDRWVRLNGFEILDHDVDAYAIVSSVHLNHLSNGILSMCDGTIVLFANLFEYDTDMKFNADKKQQAIEEYGLTPRSALDEYKGFWGSDYEDYNLKYFSILVGKGYISWEEIKKYSDYFEKHWEQ